eukprot:12428104-Karenia_brevis.AAC.1
MSLLIVCQASFPSLAWFFHLMVCLTRFEHVSASGPELVTDEVDADVSDCVRQISRFEGFSPTLKPFLRLVCIVAVYSCGR